MSKHGHMEVISHMLKALAIREHVIEQRLQ